VNVWHPRAQRIIPLNVGPGIYAGGPWRQILHTTEAKTYRPDRNSYYGHQNWPHATASLAGGVGVLHQHFPIDRSARAMENDPGGVETNRLSAVQLEIAWTAADIDNLPEPLADVVHDWVTWVAIETGAPVKAPRFVGPSESPAGEAARQRMSAAAWASFTGVCGHQHVPENAHWDPGLFPWSRIFAAPSNSSEVLAWLT
jgi:hypothetical protein